VETGAIPSGGAAITDIDGDGQDEIAVGLESPGNMVRAGGRDDGRSYVLALTLDGTVLWDRELGGTYGTVAVLPTGDYGRGRPDPLRPARFEAPDGPGVGALVGTGQTLHFLRLARNPVPLGWWAAIVIDASLALVRAHPA
jgi:hypothetical protein